MGVTNGCSPFAALYLAIAVARLYHASQASGGREVVNLAIFSHPPPRLSRLLCLLSKGSEGFVFPVRGACCALRVFTCLVESAIQLPTLWATLIVSTVDEFVITVSTSSCTAAQIQ